MATIQKKCPMCAETIRLAQTVCEYCGARFEVSITGYCTYCHQIRDADEQGCCKTCNHEIIDRRIESRLIEEPDEQPPQPVTITPSPAVPRMPNKRIWVWILGSVVVLGIIALGYVFAPKLAPIILPATATPTLTATAVPSATPTPTSTRTPFPTPTITPMPAWFIEFNKFAKPILDSIKDRPPDFQDDFSGAQRWLFHSNNSLTDSFDLVDGSLLMKMTSPTSEGGACFATNSNVLFNDFVLQVDADLSQVGQRGELEIDWRRGGDGTLILSLGTGGHWRVYFCGSCYPYLMEGDARLTSISRVPITIISRGTEYVLLLDNVAVGYVDDVGRRPARRIQLGLWVEQGGLTSSIKYSNLRIWDISQLTIP